MSSVLSIAASGMFAAQQRLEVAARNIANVRPTDEEAAAAFTALRADQVELSGGGTAVNVTAMPPEGGSDVDLASEAVQLTIARYTFAANASVMRAAAKMQKSVLDITA
jgi:flagellar basal-body rod protein FlgC